MSSGLRRADGFKRQSELVPPGVPLEVVPLGDAKNSMKEIRMLIVILLAAAYV